jgi:hypothetical protein
VALDLSEWGVKALPNSFAEHCGRLVFVKFPPTLKRIEEFALTRCQLLVEASLSCAVGLEEIGSSAFWGCISLRRIDLPPSVRRIGAQAFECCSIVELDLSHLSGGLVLQDGAFFGCIDIVDVALPSSAKIGYQALSGLRSLRRLRSGRQTIFHKNALDGTRIGTVELSDAGVADESSPEPVVRVVGEMPKLFPERVQVLDLSCTDSTILISVNSLPFLRKLIVPRVLERIGKNGAGSCPRLDEVIFGEAGVRRFGRKAFSMDFALERFPLPATLQTVKESAFDGTSIQSFDASDCASLESLALSSVPIFVDLVLPSRFSGVLSTLFTKSIERATFGSVSLDLFYDKFVLVFGEARFTALGPPRGDFSERILASALLFAEMAQLFGREAAAARPP